MAKKPNMYAGYTIARGYVNVTIRYYSKLTNAEIMWEKEVPHAYLSRKKKHTIICRLLRKRGLTCPAYKKTVAEGGGGVRRHKTTEPVEW